MTFFMKKGSRPGAKKRKLNGAPKSGKKKGFEENEEILSDDSDVMGHDSDIESHTDEDDEETSDQKRVRLAKMYLEEIEREEKERGVEDEIRDSVNDRLMTDALEEKGKLFRTGIVVPFMPWLCQLTENISPQEANMITFIFGMATPWNIYTPSKAIET
ncbi:RRP9 [Lepeophtheirus salmonis]|uniref:RRP9 n=1 Tax=Lepeophtheirus salmonis TaxID=72036 RepID=A0A7R8CTV2_LEPSM|nr:RRP9 [Lepeophtheirus salmonis]CAF2929762.1 RRP9 [Lepeophtheirus salmonis]